ncbi:MULTISPECIES: hypothetical protein [unclassified Microbacterium]|uniref:hypothetical protein n=1 Tax=unclassified Microbacterium TaxID=2609290 RepID=UPI003017DBDA
MTDTALPPARALWACVAAGFYVGSREGTFLGYVDRQASGSWRAFDASSRVIGDFDDHHAAMAAADSESTRGREAAR